jgi:hypothetical protein
MSEITYKLKIKNGNYEFEVNGDKEFVEKYFSEYYIQKQPSSEKKPDHTREDADENLSSNELDNLSLVEFYKLKDPKDLNETSLVFAYWLRNKKGVDEFKTSDITKCFDEIRLPKPNTAQHIAAISTAKKPWLTQGSGKGMYKITLSGEEFVEKSLPHSKQGK